MNTRIQLWCVAAGPLFLALYVIAFWGIGHYMPPHPPSLSAADVAAFYELHRNQVRIAQLLCLIFSTLLFPWFAVISVQMARIEGRFPVLALMQFGGATLLVVFFALCSMLWIIAAWRPGLDPNIVQLIHDGSWLIFVMVFPAYTMQMISISIAGFIDKSSQPTFPRWFCYFNLWIGFSGMGGGLATFFTDGPFAWNGLIGFWIPVAMFGTWLVMMAVLLKRAIERQAALAAA